MIDTDKYEGHTPGPWQFDGIECVSGCGPHPTEEPVFATLHVDEQFMLTEENMLANGKLIADAPDLLAEVKALQLDLKDTVDICDRLEEQEADALAEVERLRKKLFEAELWVMNDSYTFENDMKELNDYAEAMEDV
jgi:hypothetical protein